jgi:hypothetical protein
LLIDIRIGEGYDTVVVDGNGSDPWILISTVHTTKVALGAVYV